MQLISVNVGRARSIPGAARSGVTGIYKEPVTGAVTVTAAGLAGDTVCNTRHHGGPDQAVYVYGAADYEWWSRALGADLAPGTFGENLTLSDLESATLNIGDRLRIGDVLLEVTAPRIPCGTLAARMEDSGFVRRFRDAARPGVYCRVLAESVVRAGLPVTLEPYSGDPVSVLEVFHSFYAEAPKESDLRRYLAAPLARRARVIKERQLRELIQSSS